MNDTYTITHFAFSKCYIAHEWLTCLWQFSSCISSPVILICVCVSARYRPATRQLKCYCERSTCLGYCTWYLLSSMTTTSFASPSALSTPATTTSCTRGTSLLTPHRGWPISRRLSTSTDQISRCVMLVLLVHTLNILHRSNYHCAAVYCQ